MKVPTQTDMARWLNDHGETLPKLKKLNNEYVKHCKRGNREPKNFGFWFQSMHLDKFKKLHSSWFVKHAELLETVYQEDETLPLQDVAR